MTVCCRPIPHLNRGPFSDSSPSKLNELVETIESVIRSRLLAEGPSSISLVTFGKPSDIEHVPLDKARLYVDSYFRQLHPIYPFLDRKDFEDKVFGPNRSELLSSSCAFSALYHAVLALGCQYHEGGAFDPGNGRAWKLFQVSLGLVSDILIPREALMSLQSIFAMTTCCLQIDEVLLMEAARMAQCLGYHRALRNGDQRLKNTCHRTFWVIYYLEKQMCFQHHQGSMISDYNIGCPVPDVPESVFGGYNWFLSAIGFGRILSLAYTSLFSVSAAIQTTEAYYVAIEEIEARLERWRTAVPVEFRPGMPFEVPNAPSDPSFLEPSFKMVVLQTSFSYYGLVIALARLKMYIGRQDQSRTQGKSKRLLMDTARSVVEASKNIDMAAHTPIL
ncbi:fungal specific transcription factor domain-containing protein [Aspergillus fischeri NRRL 181]|uniref:Fungal specific transcription factor, putative n=1 Tax=Neosartorya fischeri (strain ATCC 1020 / DSM 3700 / CBS 544.65 / FGSC A1164 / JCM 1740 / NRRL 181 / WB 181) TaxID=331117 RepID=A1DK58_NEOFI|nr:fungal specific transcription factor, putative [Aspergillus fischeri NRRL 181]EAW17097.1 fungal specific transcription factor, putative [Aspergillus fischeri NRRL 181]